MAKRKGTPEREEHRTTLRLADDVRSAMGDISIRTGWSLTECASFFANAGMRAMFGGGKGIEQLRARLMAAIDAKQAHRLFEKLVQEKEDRLQQTEVELMQLELPSIEVPERIEMTTGGGKPAKKKRGRPPKHRAEPLPELNPETASGTLPEAPEGQ